jgi:hypothetical protein
MPAVAAVAATRRSGGYTGLDGTLGSRYRMALDCLRQGVGRVIGREFVPASPDRASAEQVMFARRYLFYG